MAFLLSGGRAWAPAGPQEVSGAAAGWGMDVTVGAGGGQSWTPPPFPLPCSEGDAPGTKKEPWVCNEGPPVSLDLGLWMETSVEASWPGSGSHPRRERMAHWSPLQLSAPWHLNTPSVRGREPRGLCVAVSDAHPL